MLSRSVAIWFVLIGAEIIHGVAPHPFGSFPSSAISDRGKSACSPAR